MAALEPTLPQPTTAQQHGKSAGVVAQHETSEAGISLEGLASLPSDRSDPFMVDAFEGQNSPPRTPTPPKISSTPVLGSSPSDGSSVMSLASSSSASPRDPVVKARSISSTLGNQHNLTPPASQSPGPDIRRLTSKEQEDAARITAIACAQPTQNPHPLFTIIARFVGTPTDLSSASGFLGVSKGPEYYKGESLEAILGLIHHSGFRAGCFAMYADTLDAYNLMTNNATLTLEKARQLATQEGDAWLASSDGQKIVRANWNRPIIRWLEILQHTDFQTAKALIDSLYIEGKDERKRLELERSNPHVVDKLSFSEAVDRVIGARIATIKSSMLQEFFDFQRIRPLIKDYILEECAGELVISRNFTANYELYPGERNSAATWVHQHLIDRNNLKWLTIKLTKTNVRKSPIDERQNATPFNRGLIGRPSTHGLFSGNTALPSPTALPSDSLDALQIQFIELAKKSNDISCQLNGRIFGNLQLLSAAREKGEPISQAVRAELVEIRRLLHQLEASSSQIGQPQTFSPQ